MTNKIYGIDPDQKFNAEDVKRAIVRCFRDAHKKILDEYKEYNVTSMSEKEMEELKTLNVEIMMKKFFKESGGDYDNPTKKDLKNLCDELAKFAKNFRSDEIIKKHYNKIIKLVDTLD